MNPKDLLRWTAIAASYFALQAIPAALYGDNPAMRGANAAAVFVLLLARRREWPVLAVLLWVAGSAAREITHAPWPWLVGACNVLEMFGVAAVMHGLRGLQSPWYRRDQLWRLLLAAGGVPVLSALAGAAVLRLGGPAPFATYWLTWYLASALAYVIGTPVLLTWTHSELRSRSLGGTAGWRSTGILLLSAACVALLRQEVHPPLLLLTFPLVVLATWLYGLPGATSAMAALALTGGFFAARDVGALALIVGSGGGLPERVRALQLYLGAIVLCGLPFAVLLAEQQLLWSQLRRRSDARAQFLAAMSHEIRTPMTGVLGMADLLAAQDLGPEPRRYVDAMRASGRHLLSVINDILDFSRIESGQLALEKIDFDLVETIAEVRSLIHPLALEKGLAFDARLAPGSPAVLRGDPTRLRQILLNLAGNAVKFTSSGSVDLHVQGEADAAGLVHLRFEVRDTGIGIAPDQLPDLFTAFSQADRSTARKYGGSGLGLAISRRLAAAMGGRIEVSSRLGEGSVFTLAVAIEAGYPEFRPTGADPALETAPQRILVAEDVQINRDLLKAALGARGHHLVFAHDGAAAVACVQQEMFDLILMDVQMPVMDGVEATQRIRAMPGLRGRIPIVGLTANVMSEEQARYLEAGMDECLPKPIEWERLDAAIGRHASGRGSPGQREAGDPGGGAARAPMDVPLLEERQIASLRRMADPSEFTTLMRTGMDAVERTVAEITGGDGAAAIGAAAHRLKGSAGMMGLARISALAASLEEACAAGDDLRATQQVLADCLRDTRGALASALVAAEGAAQGAAEGAPASA